MERDTLSPGGETAARLQSKDNGGEKRRIEKKGARNERTRARGREREREKGEGRGRGKRGAEEGERKRDEKAKVNEKRETRGSIGSRTKSFGLACLACYDGISEMVEPRHRYKKRLTMQKTLHPV